MIEGSFLQISSAFATALRVIFSGFLYILRQGVK